MLMFLDQFIHMLPFQVSILKHEKEILNNSERRASDEVRNLSERVHRLQVLFDTVLTIIF